MISHIPRLVTGKGGERMPVYETFRHVLGPVNDGDRNNTPLPPPNN